MTRPKIPEPRYLGDGAYASCDGYHVWLAANHHENRVIALEYPVFVEFCRYAAEAFGVEVEIKRKG